MRLYVPLGSTLLSVSGHTRETVRDPIDYDALEFLRDEDVSAMEASMIRDEETGTQIFEESGKTVFGNWVYVSPKETTTVTYRYALPFRIDMTSDDPVSFSLATQKQPGTSEKAYTYTLRYPEAKSAVWKSDSWSEYQPGVYTFSGDMDTDHFFGVVLGGKSEG
jgi:hypothetical protein